MLELPKPAELNSLWGLDPDVVFLNHGSFGACPTEVLRCQRRYQDRMESEPVRFFVRELPDLLDQARQRLAAFVGADASSLVFVPNATNGVNAVLRSFPLDVGDEIVIFDHVYNAVRNTVDFVANRAGACVRTVEVPFPIHDSDIVIESVLKVVNSKTVLAVLDHITSPTGLVMPLEELVPALKERGVETLVDGAHAPGQLALTLDQLGAAYYVGNCHKWMCAPKGAALLYVRPDRQEWVRPTVISHGAKVKTTHRSRFHLEFDWCGTMDPSAYLTVPDAIDFIDRCVPGGWAEVRQRNRRLALQSRRVLMQALQLEAPCPESMVAFLAALPLPAGRSNDSNAPLATDPLQDMLFYNHRIEVPIIPWPTPPNRLLRTSSQLYNTIDQAEYLARALLESLRCST